MQRLAEEVAFQIVGDFRLKVPAALRPLFEEPVQLLDVDEQMVGLADLRLGAGKGAHGIDQVGRSRSGCRTCRNCRRIGPGDLHLGQVPLTKRSARNVPAWAS